MEKLTVQNLAHHQDPLPTGPRYTFASALRCMVQLDDGQHASVRADCMEEQPDFSLRASEQGRITGVFHPGSSTDKLTWWVAAEQK